jgi:hypothetical protein
MHAVNREAIWAPLYMRMCLPVYVQSSASYVGYACTAVFTRVCLCVRVGSSVCVCGFLCGCASSACTALVWVFMQELFNLFCGHVCVMSYGDWLYSM